MANVKVMSLNLFDWEPVFSIIPVGEKEEIPEKCLQRLIIWRGLHVTILVVLSLLIFQTIRYELFDPGFSAIIHVPYLQK